MKKQAKKLSLHKETLTLLKGSVVGGSDQIGGTDTCPRYWTGSPCKVDYCV